MPTLSWHEHARGIVLQGPYWNLDYDLFLGLFDLTAPAFPSFVVRWARARALYRLGGRFLSASTDDGYVPTWKVDAVEDIHGPGLCLTVQNDNRRRPALEFAATIYRDSPFLTLEMTLHNTLSQTITVEALKPLEIDPEWGGKLSLGRPISGLYGMGWQSWTRAGWRPADARSRHTSLGPLTGPMHNVPLWPPLRPGHLRADLVGVLTSSEGPALLAGLLSAADQFGALEAHLRGARTGLACVCSTDGVPLAPGERLSSERVGLLLSPADEKPLETYAAALGKEMEGRVRERPPIGWCSWTAFYQKVSQEDILQQLDWLAEHRADLPVKVVQVDDGWEKAVGDWEPNERFPRGMKWLAEEIRRAGFTPGLWLAPLIVHPQSQLAEAHPEWLLRTPRGRPAGAGFGWGRICYGLDVTHPEVQEWLHRLIAEVTAQWGYTYLKLDFLYAGALQARRRRPAATRAQALRRALEIIRAAAGPETFLLGCGCPLGPAVGLVDAMRIGTDVAPNWRPRHPPLSPLLRHNPDFPATASAIRNTLTRAWTHRRLWLNDPDALILRRAGSHLTPPETQSLVTAVALSGGVWMLGDSLPALETERQAWGTAGLPPHPGRPWTVDLLTHEFPSQIVLEHNGPWGNGWLVALFNWQDRPADLFLDLSLLGLSADTPCHLHEFWTGEYRRVQSEIRFAGVEPHGCRTFLLRRVEEGPQWVGSTLHLVQGMEVRAWESGPQDLALTLEAGRTLGGYIVLALPQAPVGMDAQGGQARLEMAQADLWQVHVQTDGPAPCRVTLRF